jgi:hypothetical protein
MSYDPKKLSMVASNYGFPRKLVNDPSRAGQLLARKKLFGEHSRYAIAPVHTRFKAVEWFVWDAERLDETGRPEVVRQEKTIHQALEGLL